MASDGPNELPRRGRRGLGRILLDVLREPMFLLLLSGGGLYLIIGDIGEALLLLAFASVSVWISVFQEYRTERSLEALRDLASPRALVIRDGERRRIAGREVVRGDLVVLAEGDRLPADVWLREASEMQIDESTLTGESVPVAKLSSIARPSITNASGGEGSAVAFSGTLVVHGQGLGEVLKTGAGSALGRIGAMLDDIDPQPTRLHGEVRRLVRWAGSVAAVVSLALLMVYGLAREAWLDGLLAGITMAMSMMPEEFPLVLTVFLALGARRIARQHVLARRAAAIEALGATTVLCTDKTGTLTQNRMRVAQLRVAADVWRADGTTPMPESLRHALMIAVLASEEHPADPMEIALHDLATMQGAGSTEPLSCLHRYGISPALLAMGNVWEGRQHSRLLAVKGAPEAVAQLCCLGSAERAKLDADLSEMARSGLRVLAIAEAPGGADIAATTLNEMGGLRFIGLVGLADPLKPSVPDAIAQCREAGIRVVMITGDYPTTAIAIAQQAGIDASMGFIIGAEVDALGDTELEGRLRQTCVCARVMPQHKLRIVEALRRSGEIVAMTGDGVNDAPSLKAAHIGVAMGGRGTDVAREAAGLVLLNDEFGSLVEAIRLGRRIFDNLRKAMGFIVAVHVPIAGLSLLPVLIGWPPLFFPAHIVFLELIIDPVCSIVFEAEPEEADVMRRPPRNPQDSLLTRRLFLRSLLQGGALLVSVMVVYESLLSMGAATDIARATSYALLIIGNLALVLTNESFSGIALRGSSASATYASLATLSALALILMVPELRGLFSFGLPGLQELGIGTCALAVFLAALYAIKRPRRRN